METNNQNELTPENLVLKAGCHILRIDNYYDVFGKKTCRINCIDDLSTSTDEDDDFYDEEHSDAYFYVDSENIDKIISKLQEAKEFLNQKQ